MQTGAQLYTVRMYTQTEADFAETIRRVAEIGYKTVQISGIGVGIKPERVRAICDEYGLEIVITHNSPDRILNDTDSLIEEHRILGCRYIGLGVMPEKYRSAEWLRRFAEDFKPAAARIADAGMQFMYHNHDLEFRRVKAEQAADDGNGKRIIEYLTEWFAPEEMGIILDTYWVQAAGADVCWWIRKLKDRIPCVHLKDMEMTVQGPVMAPVMEGNLNFEGILEALEESCCNYLLVEQDFCRESPCDCLKKSYDNLAAARYR